MDMMLLMMNLEASFDITMEDDEFFTTAGDLLSYQCCCSTKG